MCKSMYGIGRWWLRFAYEKFYPQGRVEEKMIDIEELKPLIIERLKPLKPDKIILFGSYAYGEPNEESDMDLFLIKDDLQIEDVRNYKLELQKRLFDLQKKYLLGIDIFVDNTERMRHRIKIVKDQFYSEILSKGIKIYG